MRMKYFFSFLTGWILMSHANAQSVSPGLKLEQLTGDFYVYISYGMYQGEPVPANGMYLVTEEGVILFDTPWDTTQFQPLLDSIEKRHQSKVILCFATHFHNDRTAGLEYYSSKGIRTYTGIKTDSISALKGYKRANHIMYSDTVFRVGGHSFELFYPGEGHAPDNIVIWFERERILYGGCLIKSVKDENLGYLGDANTAAYANTVQRVIRKYRNPRFVITGHGDWKHVQALQHTWKMARKVRRKGKA